jgi:cytochrome c oxidase assembly factor CtaG
MPWPVPAIVAAGVFYFLGGRGLAHPDRRREASFYLGLAVLIVAVDSPVDWAADRHFWVHMIQHVLLMMVAPPLLLLGRPWPRLLRPLPRGLRLPIAREVLAGATLGPARAVARWLASPLPAFVLFNGTLLAWHIPSLYDLTLRNAAVHELEHTLFLGTALMLWVHLLPSTRAQLSDGRRVAYGTGALLVSWVLALVLGVGAHPLYDAYPSLTDQQIAAGIMWVPGSVPFCIALAFAVYRWLDPEPRRRRPVLRPREI